MQVWGQNCQMVMTFVSGHSLGYEFTGSYHKWYGCHPLSLFDAPVSKQCLDENYINIKRTLEREVRSCNALIIWTDCDREGKNIDFKGAFRFTHMRAFMYSIRDITIDKCAHMRGTEHSLRLFSSAKPNIRVYR